MKKNKKYEEIAKLLFKNIANVEKKLERERNELEKHNEKKIIKIYMESGDIMPLKDFAKIVGIEKGDKRGDEFLTDYFKITDKNKEITDKEIEDFFNKYL